MSFLSFTRSIRNTVNVRMLEAGVEGLGRISIFFCFCLFDLPSESLKGKQLEIKVKENKTW